MPLILRLFEHSPEGRSTHTCMVLSCFWVGSMADGLMNLLGEYTSGLISTAFLRMDEESKGNLSQARYQKDRLTWSNGDLCQNTPSYTTSHGSMGPSLRLAF